MRWRLIWTSLLCAFLFELGIFVVGGFFEHTDAEIYLDYLLGPGAWIAYGLLEGNVHELSPSVICETVNVLFYWIIFVLLFGLLGRRRARRAATPVQG
jgi:hypothetical protein